MAKNGFEYINPVTFAKSNINGRFGRAPFRGAVTAMHDYDAFMGGAGKFNGMLGGATRAVRQRALGTARLFGGVSRMSQPLSNTFSLMGREVSYGRAGLTGGLGLLALRNGANMMDRMRYGDYGGAMLSGAMTAAAGYGAYSAWMMKGSMRSHLNKAAAKLLGNIR